MEESEWVSNTLQVFSTKNNKFSAYSDHLEETHNEIASVVVDLILPDDLLERILAYLPIASIFRVGCVCKRWNEIVSSRRFLWNSSHSLSQKPWYFMFTSSDEPSGYAYDPVLRKWYGFDIPCINTSHMFFASSCGLVCSMDIDSRSELFICNPLTRIFKKLQEPPGLKFSDYSALAISVNQLTKCYHISIMKSKLDAGNFYECEVSIHVYDSVTMMWTTPLTEVLNGWRGGDESVICNGTLYSLIYSTGGGMLEDARHGVITYTLSGQSTPPVTGGGGGGGGGSLIRSLIRVPCSLTCGRLVNSKGKLVLVGGIGKPDKPDIIKGIGIWVLRGKEWDEMGRMPYKFFQGFGEFDDVFASGGTDDLVFIQSYGAPVLLIFDLNQKHWKWSQKCPVTKRFPLQLFTGFCFEPRLGIEP